MKKAGEVVESLLFTSGRVGVPTEAIAGSREGEASTIR